MVSTHSQKQGLSITQALNKSPKQPLVTSQRHLSVSILCKISAKILNSMVVGAQSFEFFSQIGWFLGNHRALFKFKYSVLDCLISIIKLQSN